MTTNYHTAISVGAAANAATFNTPLGALDEAISNAQTGVYNVLDYGAIGNAGGNYAAEIQAAINAAEAAGGGIVWLPEGTYRITAGLTCDASSVTIRGAGMYTTTLHLSHATANAISGSGSISGFDIENLTIICFDDSNNTRTAGSGISLADVGDWRIENVRMLAPWIGINLDTASTGRIYNCAIEGYSTVATTYGLNTGIKLADQCISIVIRDTNITSGAGYDYGISILDGMDTLVIDSCGVTGATKCIYLHNVNNVLHDPRWIRIHDCLLEPATTTGYGIHFSKCYDVEVSNLYISWGLWGLYFSTGSNGIKIRGGIIQLAYQYGILIDGGTNIDIDGMHVTDNSQQTDNTYDGIIVAQNVSQFSITNCRTGNFIWNGAKKQAYGINIQGGTSDYYRIINNSSNGDSTGAMVDLGTGANKTVINSTQQSVLSTGIIINDGGNDWDTRIEGNNEANLLVVDAGTDRVGVAIAAPLAKLHVDQSSSSGAVPVLTVDQADVSEEFIRFIGTSTTDASQSLVDAADMEDPGAIVGWLKIYVQDDQATNPITDGAYYIPFYSAPTHSA